MPYFVSSSEQKLIHRFKDPTTDTVTMSLLDQEIIVPLGGTRLSFLDAQKLAHGYHCPLVSEESCLAALGIIHRFQSALKSILFFSHCCMFPLHNVSMLNYALLHFIFSQTSGVIDTRVITGHLDNCRWDITVKPGWTIRLDFNYFDEVYICPFHK